VRVGVHQARYDCRALEVDDPGGVTPELHCVDAAAGEQDLVVPDRDGLGIRVPAACIARRARHDRAVGAWLIPVERVRAGVDQDQAGAPGLGGLDGFTGVFGTAGQERQQYEGPE